MYVYILAIALSTGFASKRVEIAVFDKADDCMVQLEKQLKDRNDIIDDASKCLRKEVLKSAEIK